MARDHENGTAAWRLFQSSFWGSWFKDEAQFVMGPPPLPVAASILLVAIML
jgi:hypothetical protein